MTEGATIKEVVDIINASFPIDWKAEAAHIRKRCSAATVPFDPSPAFCVVYYPFCDCGAPVLERIETPYEPFLIVTSEYMETCYECGVVSSD